MSDAIREIDTGQAMTPFARGWHCLGPAEAFRDGKPHGVDAFGTHLVDAADVTPGMTDRYEQEVDTSHGYDLWQQEVERNMAARQG